jgi:HEPN domain-containing protein
VVGLFSKRYRDALQSKKLPFPSFSRTLRKRLAMNCREFTEEFGGYDYTDSEDLAMSAVKMAYGKDVLRVQDDDPRKGDRDATGFEDFMVFAYPHHVLDALEAFYCQVTDSKVAFQKATNAILEEEGSPWRMADGRMYLVDSRFVDALKSLTADEMKREGWLGAQEEFTDARSHLQAGEADDAIHKANRAFESALQSLLNQKGGTAGDLLKDLKKTDLLAGIPEEVRKVVVSKVLEALPVLRNNLAGHGQGEEHIEVPRAYGELAINLAATYIKFLLDLKRELPSLSEVTAPQDMEDDIPF